MVQKHLRDIASRIVPVDPGLAERAKARLDSLTKPPGSLGRLEEMAARLFMISEGRPPSADPARIYTVAADHGVAAQGISAFPSEVTYQMVQNFLAEGAAINVLCKTYGIDLKVVDAGVASGEFAEHPKLIRAKVMPGTADFTLGPAMPKSKCEEALHLGLTLAEHSRTQDIAALGGGDMGIGNTTASAALFCAYLGLGPDLTAGPGTGLDKKGVSHKASVVAKALEVNRKAVSSGDPVRILAALGGLEIAALTGLFLGAALHKIPVAIDGYIATAAYAAAYKICPHVADYAFFAHASAEPGHALVLSELKAGPLLDLGMRLGEGTGAALALALMRGAADIFNNMATFDSAKVSKS